MANRPKKGQKMGKSRAKSTKKSGKGADTVTQPVTETPEKPALQGDPVGKKRPKVNLDPMNQPLWEVPPTLEELIEASPAVTVSTVQKVTLDPDQTWQVLVKGVKIHTPEQLIERRAMRVCEVAQEVCELIEGEITEELFLHPDTPLFNFQMALLPDDVCALVISKMQEAGWKVIFNADSSTLEIGLPIVSPVAVLEQKRQSTINPL
jgi:hypothetical protein